MNQDSSLLSRIKSKYILQKILSFAFGNIKPVFKLFKYNKVLLSKIDINVENIKDNYKHTIQKKVDKYKGLLLVLKFTNNSILIILFIYYLIYIILFYTRGKFKGGILREKYNKNRKKYIDIMDKYFLPIYFGFIIITFILYLLLFLFDKFAFKGFTKFKYLLFNFVFDFIHYILYIIKFAFTKSLIREEISKELTYENHYLMYDERLWFYSMDIHIISFLSFYIFFTLIVILAICFDQENYNDEETNILVNITGIKIVDYKLPENFSDLSEKERINLLFSKSNMEQYKYELNKDQITLIRKMNDIRKKYNIPSLDYVEEEKLPEFVINGKTEMFLYENENIYKLSLNLYIFKYPKNEFQNQLDNSEVLNIITNDSLKEVNIIEINNFEYISIYTNNSSNNTSNNKNINLPKITIDTNAHNINTVNSEDMCVNLSVTDIK